MKLHPEIQESELSNLRQQVILLETEKNILLNERSTTIQTLSKYQQFAELTSDTFLTLNRLFEIIDCNASALNLFECDNKDEIIGKSLFFFISPDARHTIQQNIGHDQQTPSGIKIETTVVKKSGLTSPATLTFSNSYDRDGFSITIIRDNSQITSIQEEANKQIEVLAKLAIFNNEIKQAQSCNDLKKSLCNQCILLTEADEVWVLNEVSANHVDLVYCNNQANKLKHWETDTSNVSEKVRFLDTPKDIYIFENNDIIAPPGLPSTIQTEIQYIIGTKLHSGNWTLLGLNYENSAKAKNNSDLELLRNIFSQVSSAFDNLSTYEKLIENENRFRAIIEKSDNVVCVLNKDMVYTYVSPSIHNYLFAPQHLVGKKPGNFIHPDDRHLYLEALNKMLLNQTETITIPSIRSLREDGADTYISIDITNMMHVKGVEGLVINIRDINQRIQYEIKLRQSEEKFRNIFNSGNDPVYIADLQGNFLEVNDIATTRTGVTKEEFLSTNLQNFSTEIPHEKTMAFISDIIKLGSANTEESYIDKEGNRVYFQITGKLIDYNNGKALMLRTINISDRKKIERQILDTVIKTEESERARFARELHDGIGPYLSAIKFFLQTLSRETDNETRHSITHKALESIDEIIRNIKEISNNISPRVLNHFGIIPAINTLVKKVSDNHVAINITSNIEGIRFSENMEINIFRIYTELINNSLKHAQATKLDISIMKENNRLIASYADNGIGFNFKKKFAIGKGSGLYNISNRVESLYGKYEFKSCANNNGLKFKATFEIK